MLGKLRDEIKGITSMVKRGSAILIDVSLSILRRHRLHVVCFIVSHISDVNISFTMYRRIHGKLRKIRIQTIVRTGFPLNTFLILH